MTSVDNPAIDEKSAQQIGQAERRKLVYDKVYAYMANSIRLGWQTMEDIRISMNCLPVGFKCDGHEVVDAINALITRGLVRVDPGSGALNQGGPFLYMFDETKPGPCVDVDVDVKKTRKIADRALTGKVLAALNKSRHRTVNEIVQTFPDLTVQQVSAVLTRLHQAGEIKRSKGRIRKSNFRATWGYKLFSERPHYAGKGRTKDFLESAGVESETPPEGVVPVRDIEAAVTDLEFHLSLAEGRKKEVETEIAEKKAAREALLALM